MSPLEWNTFKYVDLWVLNFSLLVDRLCDLPFLPLRVQGWGRSPSRPLTLHPFNSHPNLPSGFTPGGQSRTRQETPLGSPPHPNLLHSKFNISTKTNSSLTPLKQFLLTSSGVLPSYKVIWMSYSNVLETLGWGAKCPLLTPGLFISVNMFQWKRRVIMIKRTVPHTSNFYSPSGSSTEYGH